MNDTADDVTRLLLSLNSGRAEAWGPLLELVYEELRRLARDRMAGERRDHTLQPTALVHEAFIRLVKDENLRFSSRQHFLSIAARAMERVLIDHARARGASKRNADLPKVQLTEAHGANTRASTELSANREEIAAALAKLETLEGIHGKRKADVVRLRYLLEFSLEEVAGTLEISVDTVQRDLHFALAWLADQLKVSRE